MPQEKNRKERLVALAVTLFMALNYPLLTIFSRHVTLFGIPLLYLYIFSVWVGGIIVLCLTLTSRRLPPMPPRKKGRSQ